jgi:hypothetical protein
MPEEPPQTSWLNNRSAKFAACGADAARLQPESRRFSGPRCARGQRGAGRVRPGAPVLAKKARQADTDRGQARAGLGNLALG